MTPLSRASFDFVRDALRQRSAHHLDDDKAYLVDRRLATVARRHGLRSVEDLIQRLRKIPNENLLAEVVEAMTINETFFFRDEQAFEVLQPDGYNLHDGFQPVSFGQVSLYRVREDERKQPACACAIVTTANCDTGLSP